MEKRISISPKIEFQHKNNRFKTQLSDRDRPLLQSPYLQLCHGKQDPNLILNSISKKPKPTRNQSIQIGINYRNFFNQRYTRDENKIFRRKQKNSIKNFIQPNFEMIQGKKTKKNLQKKQSNPPNFQKYKKSQYEEQIRKKKNLSVEYKGYTSTIQGSKSQNQDAVCFSKNVYVLCDGHGVNGKEIANFIAQTLHSHLASILQNTSINKTEILNAFEKTEKDLQQSTEQYEYSGCTCVCIIIQNQKFFCANLGDSKAMASIQHEIVELTEDHKPELKRQRKRIQKNGGIVRKSEVLKGVFSGPMRIWASGKKPWGPGLAISRAFGDYSAKPFGLISTPQIKQLELNDENILFVMGSDGIFDKMTKKQIFSFMKDYMLDKSIPPSMICDFLVEEAKNRWGDYRDDITVILIVNETF